MNDSHLLFSLSRFQPESTTAFVHELKFLWIFYIWLWDWGMIIGSCTSTVQSPPALFWNLKVDLFPPGFLLKYPGLILLKFVFISFSLTYAKSGLSFCIPSLLFLFFFFNHSWFLFLSCLSLFFLSWLSSRLSAYQGCLIKQDSTRFLLSSPFFVGICFCHALLLLIILSKPFLAHYCTPLTLFFYFTLNSSFFVCV